MKNNLDIKQDKNSKGQKIEYDIAIFEWTDHLKRETITFRKKYKTKKEAEEWAKTRVEQMLVISITVELLTYDNIEYPILPSRKIIFEKDFYE